MSIPTTFLQSLISQVIADRTESLEFRRGELTLAPQTVRLERREAQPRQQNTTEGSQYESQVVIIGDTSLDVAVGDRFNDTSGFLYEVIHVAPNRQVMTQAVATLVQ